jgi:bifunctional non-homologous end joining protein LigD
VLEIHPWGSRIDRLDQPDRLIIDLDPGPNVAWAAIAEAALQIKELLEILGLKSFVKTTGGKGLHVVVPLQRRAGWDEVKRFAQSVAQFMVRHDPTRYVFTVSKAQRPGKIFVDYLRNTRGATAVAAFSTRARPGARVSAPLSWDELDPRRPVQFDVWSFLRRLARLTSDPWAGFLDCRQSLTAKMKEQLDAQK